MNIVFLAVAMEKGEFAARLSNLFWIAYGKPIKLVFWIVFAILVVVPLIAFLKRLTR